MGRERVTGGGPPAHTTETKSPAFSTDLQKKYTTVQNPVSTLWRTSGLGYSRESVANTAGWRRGPKGWTYIVGPVDRRIRLIQSPSLLIYAEVRDPRPITNGYPYLSLCLGHVDAKAAVRWAREIVAAWPPGVGLILGRKGEVYWVALPRRQTYVYRGGHFPFLQSSAPQKEEFV